MSAAEVATIAHHDFRPTHYFRTLGEHDAALTVAAGDSVATSTVGPDGRDHRDVKVTGSGNPQTGPIHVVGAEPGDTLAVQLTRLAPSRTEGYSSRVLSATCLEPELAETKPNHDVTRAYVEWHVDGVAGTATVRQSHDCGFALVLPISPMLGSFGVAPPFGQAIAALTSGSHGGNMDYRGFTTGVTAYLPVFVPGALLFVGDGHALQGEGEIAGTGVEISLDVELRLDVLKGRSINWPRGESDTHIFAVGNARPLEQALQHATAELLRWLSDDLAIDSRLTTQLLGQCVEYDIANVFNPAFTVVAKLSKHLLPDYGRSWVARVGNAL